jgi:hypothetical protein
MGRGRRWPPLSPSSTPTVSLTLLPRAPAAAPVPHREKERREKRREGEEKRKKKV